MKAPVILFAFISGILTGFYFDYVALLLLITICLLFVTADWVNTKFGKRINFNFSNFCLLSLLAVIGCSSAIYCLSKRPVINDLDEYAVKGIIVQKKFFTDGDLYLLNLISINGDRCNGNVSLFVDSEFSAFPGNVLVFESKLQDNNRIKYAPLNLQSVSPEISKISIDNSFRSIWQFFYSLRYRVSQFIDSTLLDDEGRSFCKALLLADRSALGNEQLSEFRNAGVIHILAVSGMHIGILNIILLLITRPLIFINRQSRYIVIVFLIWLFVFLTGLNLSTVRAALMLTICNLAILIERRYDPFEITCYALLFILVISPDALFDMGLQLSFASVGAISLFADILNPIDKIKSKRTYNIYGMVLTTLIATGATWIITGYYFGTVALRFLPANLLLLPFLPIYMMGCIVYLTLCFCGWDIGLFATALNSFPEYMYEVLDFIGSQHTNIKVPPLALVAWFVAVPALAMALRKKRNFYFQKYVGDSTPAIDCRWMCISIASFLTSIAIIAFW